VCPCVDTDASQWGRRLYRVFAFLFIQILVSGGVDSTVCVLVLIQMLVSGGVDSTVCAALLQTALKEDQVIAVHVDNGFMRADESAKVQLSLKKLGLKLHGELCVVLYLLLHSVTTLHLKMCICDVRFSC